MRALAQRRQLAFQPTLRSAGNSAACGPAPLAATATQNGAAATNGKAKPFGKVPMCPTPAETARTVVDITNEGTLSTLSAADGSPLGTPVLFSLDKQGQPQLQLPAGGVELVNLEKAPRCSLTVTPAAYPAKAVASVTLIGTIDVSRGAGPLGYAFKVDAVLYFGGLDQCVRGSATSGASSMVRVTGEEYAAAEPDVLRQTAAAIVRKWNDERAEDTYRIASCQLGVPLSDMQYCELLWLDHLGMYVRAEAQGKDDTLVVRVPFYRPVLDDRDARSVITMAAQNAWESERNYVPPLPSSMAAGGAPAASSS